MMATAVDEQKTATKAPREICSGSGAGAQGLKVLRKSGGGVKTMKVECGVCGRRVGTYKRRTGELKGKLTVEQHWIPRPRAAKAIENGE